MSHLSTFFFAGSLTGSLTLQDRFDGDIFGNVARSRPMSVGLRLMVERVSLERFSAFVKGTKTNTTNIFFTDMSLFNLYRVVNQGTLTWKTAFVS